MDSQEVLQLMDDLRLTPKQWAKLRDILSSTDPEGDGAE